MNTIEEHKYIRDNIGYDVIEKIDVLDLIEFYENKNKKISLFSLDEHMYIRDTVGYNFIKKIELQDLPQVIQFLKIIWHYMKMERILKNNGTKI